MANGELSRRVTTITGARGWEVLSTLSASPVELRVLVAGASFPFDAVLSVRADTPGCTERLGDEYRARQDARSEHVVGVLEMVPPGVGARGPQVPALILEHAPGGSLAALLTRGGGLRPHEAATVLVGAASGLAALHEAGWAHGRLDPAAVLFRRDGCPALDGLADVRPLDRYSADRDRDAFQRLVEAVCASVPSPASWRMLTAASAALAREDWNAVIAGIVGVAEPGALELGRAGDAAAGSAAHEARFPGARSVVVPATSSGGILALLLDGNPVAELLARLRGVLGRRRSLLLVMAIPLLIGIVVLVVVPPGTEAGSHAGGESGRTAAVASRTPIPHPSASVAAPGATGEPADRAQATGPPPSGMPDSGAGDDIAAEQDPVAGDDPVVAARALLERRRECFASGDAAPECLAGVFQRGATMVDGEVAALGDAGAAQSRDFRKAAVALVQRWGEAALVSCVPAEGARQTKPASFLLVRNEAGWRIREAFGD